MSIRERLTGFISYEEQLRLFGFKEEEIDEILPPIVDSFDIKEFEAMLEQLMEKKYLESLAGSAASTIKSSDFDGIEKAFKNKEKEEQIGYDT